MINRSSKSIISNHGISRCHEPPDVMYCGEEKKQESPNIQQLAYSVRRKKKVKFTKTKKPFQTMHENAISNILSARLKRT